MYKFRKCNLFVLLVLVLVSLFTLNLKVSANDNIVDNGKATYRVEKTIEKHDIGYGIS